MNGEFEKSIDNEEPVFSGEAPVGSERAEGGQPERDANASGHVTYGKKRSKQKRPIKNKFLFTAFLMVVIGMALLIIGVGVWVGTGSPDSFWSFAGRQWGIFGPTYEVETTNRSFSDVSDLILDIDIGEVRIKSGEEFSVSGENVIRGALRIEQDGERLEVEYDIEDRKFRAFGISIGRAVSLKDSSITITVPGGTNLRRISGDVGMAAVRIDDVSVERLSLEIGMGDCRITGVDSKELSVDVGMGSITVRDTGFDSIELDTGTGDANLHTREGEASYTSKISVGVGSIEYFGNSLEGIVSIDRAGSDGSKRIDVSVGIGSIQVSS